MSLRCCAIQRSVVASSMMARTRKPIQRAPLQRRKKVTENGIFMTKVCHNFTTSVHVVHAKGHILVRARDEMFLVRRQGNGFHTRMMSQQRVHFIAVNDLSLGNRGMAMPMLPSVGTSGGSVAMASGHVYD